jgi:hypothetical protein
MKKIIVFLMVLMLVSLVQAGTVTRDMVQATPGGEVIVTLNLDIEENVDTFYIVTETVPTGWTSISSDDMEYDEEKGTFALLGTLDAGKKYFKDDVFIYKVTPPASYAEEEVFSGTFFFGQGIVEEGTQIDTLIGGKKSLTIGEADPVAGEDPVTDTTTCISIPASATLCSGATMDGSAAKLGCNPIAGACEYKCDAGLTACGTCVDVQIDNNNCGSCSNVCGVGKSCVTGQCQVPQQSMEGDSCTSTADCETGLVCESGFCTSTLSEFLQDMKEFEDDHPEQIKDYNDKKAKKSFSAKFVSAIAKFFKDLFN